MLTTAINVRRKRRKAEDRHARWETCHFTSNAGGTCADLEDPDDSCAGTALEPTQLSLLILADDRTSCMPAFALPMALLSSRSGAELRLRY